MAGITIVIKGADGSGRTQVAELLSEALKEKNFTDVCVVPTEKIDIHTLNTPFRETPVIITEG